MALAEVVQVDDDVGDAVVREQLDGVADEGRLPTGSSGLGTCSVIGRSRSPKPAARMKPFTVRVTLAPRFRGQSKGIDFIHCARRGSGSAAHSLERHRALARPPRPRQAATP